MNLSVNADKRDIFRHIRALNSKTNKIMNL